MTDPRRQDELAARIEERRRLLEGRPDVSQRLRELSSSSARNPIAPARKLRSPLVTILVSAAAAIALIACVIASIAVISSGIWVQAQLGSPNTTVEDFYAAIHSQDYPQAYSFLSHKAQSELTEERFQTVYQASDSLAGTLESYAITSSLMKDSTATVTVDVVRRGNTSTAQVFTLTLTQENGAWRITTIQQTGSTPAPTPAS